MRVSWLGAILFSLSAWGWFACAGNSPNASVQSVASVPDPRARVGVPAPNVTDEACFLAPDCLNSVECAAHQGQCVELTSEMEPDPVRRCRYSHDCRHWGKCSFDGKACVLASERDCRISYLNCTYEGTCGFRDGSCKAIATADCETSGECLSRGMCELQAERCVASVAGCIGSNACKVHGQCSLDAGRCLARNNGDCERSEDCRIDGRCGASADVCIAASDSACRNGLACKRFGRCEARETEAALDDWQRPRPCFAEHDADCKSSSACAELGLCVARDGKCQANAASCRAARICAARGECTEEKGHCVATSDADCKASVECKERGSCAVTERRCSEKTTCELASKKLVQQCKLPNDLGIAYNAKVLVGCVGESAYCSARCALDLECPAIGVEGKGPLMRECVALCEQTLPPHLEGPE